MLAAAVTAALAFQLQAPLAPTAAVRRASSTQLVVVEGEAYSTLTCGDRKVMFSEALGKSLGVNPKHTQLPMAAQSFVNEMITSEGIAMNSKKYRYSRIFAVGFNALCDIFLSAGVQPESAKKARESLVIAYGFEPTTVFGDSTALLAAAEGKSEEEILELADLKELAAADTQYSYALGAGLIALMKVANVEPSDDAIVRWCAALDIKAVNSFKRDLGYFKMNVEKFEGMAEMFKQMSDAAKKREAEREAEIAAGKAASKPSDTIK